MIYKNELAIIKNILNSSATCLETLELKWRNEPNGEIFEFKIGKVAFEPDHKKIFELRQRLNQVAPLNDIQKDAQKRDMWGS